MGGFKLLNCLCTSGVTKRSTTDDDPSETKDKLFKAEPHTSSLLGMQLTEDSETFHVCRSIDNEVL